MTLPDFKIEQGSSLARVDVECLYPGEHHSFTFPVTPNQIRRLQKGEALRCPTHQANYVFLAKPQPRFGPADQ